MASMQDYRDEEIVKWGFIIFLILLFLAGAVFTIWYLCSWDGMVQGLMIASWVAFFLIGINVIPYLISEYLEEKSRERRRKEAEEKRKKEKEEKVKENEDKENKII